MPFLTCIFSIFLIDSSDNLFLFVTTWHIILFIRCHELPIRRPIPYSTMFRISQGFFSIHYLLSGSRGHFLGLSFIMVAFIKILLFYFKLSYFFGIVLNKFTQPLTNQLPECRLLLQNKIFLQNFKLDPESDRLIQKESNILGKILVKF